MCSRSGQGADHHQLASALINLGLAHGRLGLAREAVIAYDDGGDQETAAEAWNGFAARE